MTFDEFDASVQRFQIKVGDPKPLGFETFTADELLAKDALGLAGEAGELVDLLKKHLYHGKPLDLVKTEKELGDVLWYVSAIARHLGTTLEEVAQLNHAKLSARYPAGYSPEACAAKADEKGAAPDGPINAPMYLDPPSFYDPSKRRV